MRRGLVALVLVGLAASAAVLVPRVRLEAGYRAVEIVLDGDDWLMLARREGREPARMLRALRDRGATSLAIADNTLRRLADDGLISYASGPTLQSQARLSALAPPFARLHAAGAIRTDAVYVTGPRGHLDFVAQRFRALLGPERTHLRGDVVEVIGAQQDLEEIGLGYRAEDAALARAAGLGVVLRPRNYRGLSRASLRVLVDGYAQATPQPTLIFALTEVQGYERLIGDAAAEYWRIGARFGRIEVFSARRKQRGEDRLTALMQPAVIRVFSITPEELQVLRPAQVADRFLRAAQERNIRLLYVRPLLSTPAGDSPVDVNLDLVASIARGLQESGFAVTRSQPLAPLEVPRPVMWVVAVGALALAFLVVDDLARAVGLRLRSSVAGVLLALAVLITVGASFSRLDGFWRQLLALGTAIAAATGAVVWALPPHAPTRRTSPIAAGLGVLLRALVVAVSGGLFVAALLSQWAFMLAFATFLGVKPAHAAPVVLVGTWVALGARASVSWRQTLQDLVDWVRRPLRVGWALAALALGTLGVLLLARTGNIGLPLLGAEVQLRTMLEDVLVARPRTKEFLIGYPALVLAGVASSVGWRGAALPLAMAGAVGTAGAINSFSHLHTPLLYTIWRTGNALLLGAVLAIPAAVMLLWVARRGRRS
ncbi:MAG: DUF5693 family protein [Armatimonadota bacterium]|nr:DUF5693 family protein [Armatimonadota bacterium]